MERDSIVRANHLDMFSLLGSVLMTTGGFQLVEMADPPNSLPDRGGMCIRADRATLAGAQGAGGRTHGSLGFLEAEGTRTEA